MDSPQRFAEVLFCKMSNQTFEFQKISFASANNLKNLPSSDSQVRPECLSIQSLRSESLPCSQRTNGSSNNCSNHIVVMSSTRSCRHQESINSGSQPITLFFVRTDLEGFLDCQPFISLCDQLPSSATQQTMSGGVDEQEWDVKRRICSIQQCLLCIRFGES
jgi:hypothetical protein